MFATRAVPEYRFARSVMRRSMSRVSGANHDRLAFFHRQGFKPAAFVLRAVGTRAHGPPAGTRQRKIVQIARAHICKVGVVQRIKNWRQRGHRVADATQNSAEIMFHDRNIENTRIKQD